MTPKVISKLIVDLFMTTTLLFLMAYQMVGEKAHEWLGMGMFLLFIVHQVLNKNWYLSLCKGRYTIIRIFQTVLNCLILACMLGLMISGIILSSGNGNSLARVLHLLTAYWGFVLMSLHLGFHWGTILAAIKKVIKKPVSMTNTRILQILSVCIATYGAYAFFKRSIGSYMLLTTQFVFFDFEEALILFLADHLAIMGLFVFIGYYLVKRFRRSSSYH